MGVRIAPHTFWPLGVMADMGLKIPGHTTCEFKSRRGYLATLAEWHTRQAQTLFFLSSNLRSSILSYMEKFVRKDCFIIKQITKQEIQKLLDAGIIKHSHRGYINQNGSHIGYYKTTGAAHKRYIQDLYADKAKKL